METFIKEQKKQIAKLNSSKKYFSDATFSLNQQYLKLKQGTIANLTKKDKDQNQRLDAYAKQLKFKQ